MLPRLILSRMRGTTFLLRKEKEAPDSIVRLTFTFPWLPPVGWQEPLILGKSHLLHELFTHEQLHCNF